ncbi:hypothetical protein [Runella aurantiaca]|uniref:Tetratricopeptide repeat protein n=1 Tax=Runella aurantiaca TaxID=2282308 RepID=A0A369IDW8_9BACT|nr:hypothetical protein [Runella aurantiaca]RDB06465.1 hypothetical protein DVG78_08890 [Runella aurantiaca]
MLSIFAPTSHISYIQTIIDQEFRLNEIVFVKELPQIGTDLAEQFMVVKDEEIYLPIDWANEAPPFILPYPLLLTPAHLLTLIYTKLGNYEQAYKHAELNPVLLIDIDTLNCLQHGVQVSLLSDLPSEGITDFETYRHWHNAAITAHYGDLTHFVHYETIKQYYHKAFELAPDDEWRAFTGKHLASLLLDAEELFFAEQLLEQCINFAISDDAKYELMNVQYAVWLKQLAVPYDEKLLQKIKTALWDVLNYYEKRQNHVQSALLLIDASHIANITDSFAESLGYINRAIDLLRQEEIPELLANANYRKGMLLYTWAQNGSPQFLKPAMDAYQAALRIFTRDNAPDIFAEIHHHLGVIYSEIPDEAKKKGIWAAVSVSSFKEALGYFTRETNPYEYARICNSYANVLTKFPAAAQSDNYAKALEFYREALEIRNADEYPHERALSILNFLEACWYVQHSTEVQEQTLFNEMQIKAAELLTLTSDASLLSDAQRHLSKIQKLKTTIHQ